MKILDENERHFYEIEATQNNWSVRELNRQYNSVIYERLALSRYKDGITQFAQKAQIIENRTYLLKSH
jgi:predicted nuclease of restriction endonuclease-like (RecB) superfamily